MTAGKEFSAFISYSHADRVLAKWLQSALEAYRLPRAIRREHDLPRRLEPVFLDESDMGASPNLGRELERALTASKTLIVICSPSSQQSEWVQAEVAHFRALGRGDRIILVLAEGTPEEAFPPAILAEAAGDSTLPGPAHSDIPLAADARSGTDSDRTTKQRVRLAVVSAILDIAPDELARRHQQRQVRTLATLSAISLGVAAAMIALAFVAVSQRDRAEAEERRALERLIDSKLQQGGALFGQDRWFAGSAAFDEARGLMEQLGKPLTALAVKMMEAEQHSLSPYRYIDLPNVRGLAISQVNSRLAVVADQEVHVFDVITDNRIATLETGQLTVDEFAFSPDGSIIAVANGADLRLLSVEDGKTVVPPDPAFADISSLDFALGQQRLLIADKSGRIHAWDFGADEMSVIAERDAPVNNLRLSEHGDRLAIAWGDGTTIVCKPAVDSCNDPVGIEAGNVLSVALSSERNWLATADGQFLRMWDGDSGAFLSESPMQSSHVDVIGDTVLSSDLDGDVTVFDASTGLVLARFPSPPMLGTSNIAMALDRLALFASHDNGVLYWQMHVGYGPGQGGSIDMEEPHMLAALALSSDGSLIATASDSGIIEVRDGYDLQLLTGFDAGSTDITALAFTPDSRLLIGTGNNGRAVSWNLQTGEPEQEYSGLSGDLRAIAISNDGSFMAIGNDTGEVAFRRPDSGEQIATPLQVESAVTSLSFNANDSWMAIGTDAGQCMVWWPENQQIQVLLDTGTESGHVRATAHGTNQVLIASEEAELWDVTTGQRLRRFGYGFADDWQAGVVSPDIVFTSNLEAMNLFSAASSSELATIKLQVLPLLAGHGTRSGSLFAATGLWSADIFRWNDAIDRSELRKALAALDPLDENIGVGERVEVLARWYLAHDLKGIAARYVNHPEFRQRNMPDFSLARILLADGQLTRGLEHLDQAVAQGTIPEAYATLFRRAKTNEAQGRRQ